MKIIRMQPSHLIKVTELTNQLGYPSTLKSIQNRFIKMKKLKNRGLFVAVHNNQAVGWIDLDIIHSVLHDPRGEIRALVVDSDYRGRGIGKSLIKFTMKWARTKKVKSIFLRTNIKRKGAHRFYEREHFIRTKTSYKYEINL